MFSQAPESSCTLLLMVNNELKAVAKGSIVMPTHRKFHGADTPHGVHRVRVDRPLPGCEDLYPPYQPVDADSELMVAQLRNHLLLWPKTLIRLHGTSGSVASQQGMKLTPPASAGAHDHLEHPTEDDDHNVLNIDQAPIDEFIDQLGMDQDPHDSPNPDELRAGKF